MLDLSYTGLARLLAAVAAGAACLAGLAIASDTQPGSGHTGRGGARLSGRVELRPARLHHHDEHCRGQLPAGTASCAGTPELEFPQIGYIVFAAGPHGTVTGRTDQGCTGRFARHRGGLELSPASQYCFNHIVGSGYTITRWSVTFSGARESETIIATSHLPNGNYDFVPARRPPNPGREPAGHRERLHRKLALRPAPHTRPEHPDHQLHRAGRTGQDRLRGSHWAGHLYRGLRRSNHRQDT